MNEAKPWVHHRGRHQKSVVKLNFRVGDGRVACVRAGVDGRGGRGVERMVRAEGRDGAQPCLGMGGTHNAKLDVHRGRKYGVRR